MKSIYPIICVISILLGNCYAQESKSVLIFTKTAGYRHESIPKGVATISKLLDDNHIKYVHTENSNYFDKDSLRNFEAVIFLNTTGDLLDSIQKQNFQKFIRSGKGYLGIHAASDTEFNWPWYGSLVGGYFVSHPAVQDAKINVINRKHPSTNHLSKVWLHKDEWYDFKDIKKGLNILMVLDESSYSGGRMGKFHPIAWFQEFEGGRSFYTGLGHTDESYDSELFQRHILGGLYYVLRIK